MAVRYILTLFLALTFMPIGIMAMAEDSEVPEVTEITMTNKEAAEAESDTLITALLGHAPRGNTRAGFIADVAELTVYSRSDVTVPYFSDMPLNREETVYIHGALDAGLISKGESFRPDDVITLAEAVKVVVSALGYSDYAEVSGGWPTGYFLAANTAEVLGNISTNSNELSEVDSKILLLNMLNSRVVEFQGNTQQVSSRTMLETRYKVYKTSGIITETSLNSLYSSETVKGANTITIGGYRYNTEDDYSSLIGRNVNAYYNENDEIVCICETAENTTASFTIENSAMISNLSLRYKGVKKNYTYSLSDDYALIYNGVLSTKRLDDYIENGEGKVTLLDNNDDRIYEIVSVSVMSYIKVKSVNREAREIYDDNSSANNLDMSNNEGIYAIYDSTGAEKRFVDVKAGETYEAEVSEDGMRIRAVLLSGTVSGSVSSISGDEIVIGDNTYKMTSYFTDYYLQALKPGDGGTFALSSEGKLVSFSKSSMGMRYGFCKNMYYDESGSDLYMIIFSEDNEFLNVRVADKVIIDGISVQMDKAYDVLAGGIENQLIKFRLNDENEAAAIDLSYANEGYVIKDMPEGNNLAECIFDEQSYQFKSGINMMYPYFNVATSKVFVIPNDLSDKDVYNVTNYTFFTDWAHYGNLKAYDVKPSGDAGAVLVRSDTSLPTLALNTPTFVVEKVDVAYNEQEDEVMNRVTGWENNTFKEYYIDNSISLYKASGEMLGFGDIIRYYAVNGIIKIMVCDFDANENVFARNNVEGAAEFNIGISDLNYQFGKVYSISNNYVYLTNGPDGSQLRSSLRNFVMNTSNIALVNMRDRTVKTGTLSDIKTIESAGGDADIILLRQEKLSAKSCVVYILN